MRQTTVDFRDESVDVMYRDYGYESDTNAHTIDWYFVEEPNPPPTEEEDEKVYIQLVERSGESDFSDVRDEGTGG